MLGALGVRFSEGRCLSSWWPGAESNRAADALLTISHMGVCWILKGSSGFLVDEGAVLFNLEWLVIPFVIHLHTI